ncbi:MAG: YraN family protein [Corynebacteriales bacterium]|nr:YraN family protein [Mycobacteriales bacterium]
MTAVTQHTGRFGEQIATRFLRESGYAILGRNWRCAQGELDIIARDGPVVVFCEVKTRRSERFGPPEEAVNAAKMKKLRAAASQWLAKSNLHRVGVRFDVLSVRPHSCGPADVEHFIGVF